MRTTLPRFERSTHLVGLIAEAERLAAAIAGAAPAARADLAVARREAAALATLRLDGTHLDARPDDATLAAAHAARPATDRPGRPGTWFDAMGVTDEVTAEQAHTLQALEYIGASAALDADDLVAAAAGDPVAVLGELHGRLTAGLVAPERAGVPRELAQAVHDSSTGRVLFFAAPAERIPTELALLTGWVASTGTREHALIVTGVVHHELLRIHPFDAANGRLARAAARLGLRAHGLDPEGLAAPEVALATDPLGYHEEVARTVRRGDLTIWLERWAEAVSDGLRDAARALGQHRSTPSPQAVDALDDLPDAFTVADHRAVTGLDRTASSEQLESLLDAGRIARVPGSRGLRFTLRPGAR